MKKPLSNVPPPQIAEMHPNTRFVALALSDIGFDADRRQMLSVPFRPLTGFMTLALSGISFGETVGASCCECPSVLSLYFLVSSAQSFQKQHYEHYLQA